MRTNIVTRWAEEAVCGQPLPEYPRPQMVRENWINLNGKFDYAITDEKAEWISKAEGQILVPFSIESVLSGVGKKITEKERLWYRKSFTLPESFKGKRVILHLDSVDWQCRVYVNRKLMGEHFGGYCRISYDITDALTDGENELVVWVYDPTEKGWQNRGKQDSVSHGFWYTPTTGIWKTVWLEAVSENYIKGYKLVPDIDKGVIALKTDVVGSGELKIKILDGDSVVAEENIPADAEVSVPDAKLWSPETPFLYDFVLELSNGGTVSDSVKGYFGMRKFSIGKDKNGIARLMLNNKPYFQKGLLDQGYWPDGILTPPVDEAMKYDIQKMKDLGFNMLRKHIKVESDRWYYYCDKIGMLVWQDMVSGGAYIGDILAGIYPNLGIGVKDTGEKQYRKFSREKKEWRDNYEAELHEVLDQLYNVPSICCWVPFNEGWGQFDAKRIAAGIKEYDPSRFVDHASGWYDQGGLDFKSMHKYVFRIRMPKLDGRPFVISEYGGYQNSVPGHVWDDGKTFGLYLKFKNKEKLSAAYRKLHEKQVIPLIEKGLCATVYTQVSDVEFELNGMLTYDREFVKLDEDMLRDINSKLTY
ncbi:MAG: glycoside hydrolase family 2 protein [Acutalibacteraceae bacterium]|nr:glycoside hydrolase family 2 TIM barrel-domain containing protein [Oscillospiraceae bacterium]